MSRNAPSPRLLRTQRAAAYCAQASASHTALLPEARVREAADRGGDVLSRLLLPVFREGAAALHPLGHELAPRDHEVAGGRFEAQAGRGVVVRVAPRVPGGAVRVDG